MTLALGNMGLFGCKTTASMGESQNLVKEVMDGKRIENMSRSDIFRYLNAFEVHSAIFGLNPEQMKKYCSLLKCC